MFLPSYYKKYLNLVALKFDMKLANLESELHSFKQLEDLLDVGRTKLVGYLPLAVIKQRVDGKHGIVNKIRVWAEEKGLKSKVIPKKRIETMTISDALYVWEEQGLSKFLQAHSATLIEAGIPIEPGKYIDYIAYCIVWKERFPEAYKIVGQSFNDPRWRD